MERCRLCAHAEEYLGTPPLENAVKEDSRLANIEFPRRQHHSRLTRFWAGSSSAPSTGAARPREPGAGGAAGRGGRYAGAGVWLWVLVKP